MASGNGLFQVNVGVEGLTPTKIKQRLEEVRKKFDDTGFSTKYGEVLIFVDPSRCDVQITVLLAS
jgi:hypothetical protein